MSNWEIVAGDCVEVMAEWPEDSVDSIVADPPYGIRIMGKGFDDIGDGEAQRVWHRVWAEQALRVLKPGGHLVAFGSPRTYHHLASGVEEAGFEIRDSIVWVHSQGFPKSHNIGKSVESMKGWGTALKPANEPIVLARKPFKGAVAKNAEKYGTGGLNIDATRIGDEGPPSNRFKSGAKHFGGAVGESYETSEPTEGRWPANLTFEEGIDLSDKFFYCSKPSKKERNAGLTEEKPNDRFKTRRCTTCHKNVPQAGSCGCPDAEIEWVAAKPTLNVHPTVKPIDLMRWLCLLVTPPGGLIVDPFVGSGTTGIAAILEKFDFIGIESDPEDEGYVELAIQRMEHWCEQT